MVYPYMRRVAKSAGLYITTQHSRTRSRTARSQSYPLSDGEEVKLRGPGVSQSSKKRRFRHPLSLSESQWRDETSMEDEAYMLGMHTMPRHVSIEDVQRRELGRAKPMGTNGCSEDNVLEGETEGIKVVQETIIERR